MKVRHKLIIRIIAFIILLAITMTFIFAQSTNNQNNSLKLINQIETETNLSLYDEDTFSFLLEESNSIVEIYNPSEMNIIDFNIKTDNRLKQELSSSTLDFLYDLDIEMRDNPSFNPYSNYVEPAEMRGYNFVLVEYHQPITDNNSFNKLKCYYKIYLNDKYVGSTNKGPWIDDFKFFAYNLDRGVEFKLSMDKMVAAKNSNNYKKVALKMYQPNEYLEDVVLINDTPDRIVFLLMVWRQDENGVYEAIIKTDEDGDKYLKRTSTLWKRIKDYYINK